jgi:ATP-dependent DNA helicase RecG
MDSGDGQQHLKRLLSVGEGIRVEFKEAKNSLPANLFETICAMLNRDGGDILLGVDDNGQAIGIDEKYLERLKSNIVNLSNNPQKLDPPFILFPVERSFDGKKILHLSIPASSQTHRSAGVVFDRSQDGDFRLNEPHRIAEISNRKRTTYTENRVLAAVTDNDLRLDMLPKLHNLMLGRDPNHPWPSLPDRELLVKAGLYRMSRQARRAIPLPQSFCWARTRLYTAQSRITESMHWCAGYRWTGTTTGTASNAIWLTHTAD